MKKKWIRIKNNTLYYWSVVDVAVTGFVFHVIHIITKASYHDVQRYVQGIRKAGRGRQKSEKIRQRKKVLE